MYDTHTAEIIGPSVITHPSLSLLWQAARCRFGLLMETRYAKKNPSGLLERDAENLVEKLFLWDGFELIEPAGRTKLNWVTGEKQ